MATRFVQVPEELEPAFKMAEDLVEQWFTHLQPDPARGRFDVHGERYVLVRAGSLASDLFRMVRERLGPGREDEADEFSRSLLYDLAHGLGRADSQHFAGRTDDPGSLLLGPALFAFGGWGSVEFMDRTSLSEDGFYMHFRHRNTFEAEAWLEAHVEASLPVCVLSAGYAAGWNEEALGRPLAAIEVECRACGDEACTFVMAPAEHLHSRAQELYPDHRLASRLERVGVPEVLARKRLEEDLRSARDALELRVAERTAALTETNVRLTRALAERDRAEAMLLRSQKLEALGRLAGGVAHDMNNLLGVILAHASRLRQGQDVEAGVRAIEDACSRGAELTGGLLAFSRRQPEVRRPVDLGVLTTGALELLRPVLGRVDLKVQIDPGVVVNVSAGQIEQVVVNLVQNACEAMDDGSRGKLIVRVTASGDDAILVVTDSGRGMDAVVQQRIFDPFFSTRGEAGTGLGLSVVYGIIEAHDGRIGVSSEVGRGTTFRVTLPRSSRAPTPAPPRARAMAGAGATLLVVDDEEALRSVLVSALEHLGWAVLSAGDVDEARKVLASRSVPPDLIVCDVVLPGRSGPDLTHALWETWPDLPVLYMSGHAADPRVKADVASGRAGFLAKPFRVAALAEAVRERLNAAQRAD